MSQDGSGRAKAFAFVTLAYAVAAVAGVLVYFKLSPEYSPIVAFAAADAAATVVVFLSSVAVNNSSMYDPYWSVAPMFLAPAIMLHNDSSGAPLFRKIIVIALVMLWGARLTWNWARGWQGLGHEDFRYVDLRKTTGKAYWIVSFLGLHFMPTVCVFLGCLALFPALDTGTNNLSIFDAAGIIVTLGAIYLEARADKELRAFRLTNKEPGKNLDTGVWSLCRHPNYLGEVLFWWGLFFFAMAADSKALWTIIGPLWINCLFVFISIPLMTKRALARRPAYAEHMKRIPALLPRPWK